MKSSMMARVLAMLLAVLLAISMFAGCGSPTEDSKAAPPSGTDISESVMEEESKPTETVTLTLYPLDVNLTSGVVGGLRGQFFEKNGIRLEVWAYSDEKTNAILASRDLPDVMYLKSKFLETVIDSQMVMDLDPYLDQIPHARDWNEMRTAMNYIRKYKSNGTEKLYCLPGSVGAGQSVASFVDSTDRNAVKLRWDVYEEIGAPEIQNFDDLLDVMEQMLKARPVDEEGNPFYGTILNSGSDTSYWYCMRLWFRWQGYEDTELPYMLEMNMAEGKASSILEDDSLYKAGLRWYNQAYRRGLMDPDSINYDRSTQKVKADKNLAMIPSGSLPGWAPYYYEYYIPGTTIYYQDKNTYGKSNVYIAVNAKTEHRDASLKLLDIWNDPDASLELLYGPDGDYWYSDGENAYLTEAALKYLEETNGLLTGFVDANGDVWSLWNTTFCMNSGVMTHYKDGNGNYRPRRVDVWSEVQKFQTENDNFEAWKKTTGYDSWKAWLAAENAFIQTSELQDISYFMSVADDSTQLILDSLRDTVVTASWKMVYAESDEDFEALWKAMVSDCKGLGAEKLMSERLAEIEEAKKIRDSLVE